MSTIHVTYAAFEHCVNAIQKGILIIPDDVKADAYDKRIPPHLILGIPENASEPQIEHAYTKLSHHWSPEKSKNMTTYEQQRYKTTLQTINDAYNYYQELTKTNKYQDYLNDLNRDGIYNHKKI